MAAAHFLDVFGGTIASGVVVVIVAGVLAWQRRWPGLAVWLVVTALSEGLNALIKNVYERARPPAGLVEEQTYSFVSGHSLTAAAMAIALVLVFVPAGPHRRPWLVVAVAYALLMAGSRVYLRAHWLTDTLAGVTVGAACAVTVALVASWWYARAQEPPVSDCLGGDVAPLEEVHAEHQGHDREDDQQRRGGPVDPAAQGVGADVVVPR